MRVRVVISHVSAPSPSPVARLLLHFTPPWHPCRCRLLTYTCINAGVGAGCRQSSEPSEHCNISPLLICSRLAQQAVRMPRGPHRVKHVALEQHERVICVESRRISATRKCRAHTVAVSHHPSLPRQAFQPADTLQAVMSNVCIKARLRPMLRGPGSTCSSSRSDCDA
jgi:hypothetical protein